MRHGYTQLPNGRLVLALGDAHVVNDLLTGRLYPILLFTIAVEITNALHACGHSLSGKLVHSAMDDLLIIATRDINLYLWRGLLKSLYNHLNR